MILTKITNSILKTFLACASFVLFFVHSAEHTRSLNSYIFADYEDDEHNEYSNALVYVWEDYTFKSRGGIKGMTKMDLSMVRAGNVSYVPHFIGEFRKHSSIVNQSFPQNAHVILVGATDIAVWAQLIDHLAGSDVKTHMGLRMAMQPFVAAALVTTIDSASSPQSGPLIEQKRQISAPLSLLNFIYWYFEG